MQTKLSILFFVLSWITGKPGWESTTDPCAHYYDKKLNKNIYTSVEIEPEFPGGTEAYARFINKNLKISNEMVDSDLVRSPYPMILLIIDTDGQIKNIRINNKERSDEMNLIEKETFRLVKLMPNWTPGSCQGKTVATLVKRPLAICILMKRE
jgi:hypothetical protein